MEIERKFLVKSLPRAARQPGVPMKQGYLVIAPDGTEVRVRQVGPRYEFALKRGRGLRRTEIETALTSRQFRALWPATVGRRLAKRRVTFREGRHTFEVSRYQGRLRGLVVAEVEFSSLRQARAFVPPPWLGRELTRLRAFKNQALVSHRPKF
jgi:adenylate cyclase